MLAEAVPTGYMSLATAALVVIGHLLARRDRQRRADEASAKLQQVHVMVNGRLEKALAEIDELQAALAARPPEHEPPPPGVAPAT